LTTDFDIIARNIELQYG